MDEPGSQRFLIGIVGPCGSGKSTLVAGLERRGFRGRHIAQEHSYVPSMWRKIADPNLLIFLDSSFETSTKRRKLNWSESDYAEQQQRLAHARQHADLIIETDALSPDEVLARAMEFLRTKIS